MDEENNLRGSRIKWNLRGAEQWKKRQQEEEKKNIYSKTSLSVMIALLHSLSTRTPWSDFIFSSCPESEGIKNATYSSIQPLRQTSLSLLPVFRYSQSPKVNSAFSSLNLFCFLKWARLLHETSLLT